MIFEPYGKHIIAEFYGVDEQLLNSEGCLRNIMQEACRHAGLTVLGIISNKFDPIGVSVIILIQESHLAIHTYPEYCFASIDIYTCGKTVDPVPAFNYIKDALDPEDIKFGDKGVRKFVFPGLAAFRMTRKRVFG